MTIAREHINALVFTYLDVYFCLSCKRNVCVCVKEFYICERLEKLLGTDSEILVCFY